MRRAVFAKRNDGSWDATKMASDSRQDQAAKGEAPVELPPLILSGQQKALLEALRTRDARLATWYESGLQVLLIGGNVDRLALCAHAIREVMQKLPDCYSVQMPAGSLRDKVQKIGERWTKLKAKTKLCVNGKWSGSIDENLQAFLAQFDEVMKWHAESYPSRRKAAQSFFEGMDGGVMPSPGVVVDAQYQEWDDLLRFFQNVSHHSILASESEFTSKLFALERFLSDRLLPKTFDDFRELDDLTR